MDNTDILKIKEQIKKEAEMQRIKRRDEHLDPNIIKQPKKRKKRYHAPGHLVDRFGTGKLLSESTIELLTKLNQYEVGYIIDRSTLKSNQVGFLLSAKIIKKLPLTGRLKLIK